MKGRGWRLITTVTTAEDGEWNIHACNPNSLWPWIRINIRRATGGRGSYWSAYSRIENRLSRSSDERRMFAKHPVLWRVATEALGEHFGRGRGEYARRMLGMISIEDRARLLRELTAAERARLDAILKEAQ